MPPPPATPRAPRRLLTVAVGVGAAAGVAVGVAALAGAATGPGSPTAAATAASSSSSSTSTTTPAKPSPRFGGGRLGGGAFGGLGGPGGFGRGALGAGPAIYGQETVKGANGYETLSYRTGTVSSVTDTSGSTWSLTVKSADGTTGTFTVDSGTSVNGGEMGIGSVKKGDTVDVVAVVSGSTSTAKQVTDTTTLRANGGTWQPMRPTMPPGGAPGGTGNSGTASTSGVKGPAV